MTSSRRTAIRRYLRRAAPKQEVVTPTFPSRLSGSAIDATVIPDLAVITFDAEPATPTVTPVAPGPLQPRVTVNHPRGGYVSGNSLALAPEDGTTSAGGAMPSSARQTVSFRS